MLVYSLSIIGSVVKLIEQNDFNMPNACFASPAHGRDARGSRRIDDQVCRGSRLELGLAIVGRLIVERLRAEKF